jgi:uncharacterized repeat protein (TIGR03803 family)
MAISVCVALSACSQPSASNVPGVQGSTAQLVPQARTMAATRTASTPSYQLLYTFGTTPGDGSFMVQPFLNLNGTLYGTTSQGGKYAPPSLGGTAFTISTAGTGYQVIHAFGNGSDGADLNGPLTAVNGTLYGLTNEGGAFHTGTFYSMTPSGTENVLYSFGNGTDGSYPGGTLAVIGGTLYGVTGFGGTNSAGTIFSISTTGVEHVIYNFPNTGNSDVPKAGLIAVNGVLVGVLTKQDPGLAAGAVFSINPDGSNYQTLHLFTGYAREVDSDVVNVGNTLYGTAYAGGTFKRGIVFSLSIGGKDFRILHNFGSGQDGAWPIGGLTYANGVFYGTTYAGGTASVKNGAGTIFSITPSGTEQVLHSFGLSGDGAYPEATLTFVNGTLYGATIEDPNGSYSGTIFSYTP